MAIGDIHLELDGSFKCFLGLLIMIFAIPWAGVISREGIGLHSGEKTRVTISPYEKEGYMSLSGINLGRFLS